MLLLMVRVIHMGILDLMVIVEDTVILRKMVMSAHRGQILVVVVPLPDCHLLHHHLDPVIDFRIGGDDDFDNLFLHSCRVAVYLEVYRATLLLISGNLVIAEL